MANRLLVSSARIGRDFNHDLVRANKTELFSHGALTGTDVLTEGLKLRFEMRDLVREPAILFAMGVKLRKQPSVPR